MLELKSITKAYKLKEQSVMALDGISVCFRRSEFVSILGPSGCGKTTLLNIIGGLDRYTDGELIIDGVSTKKYKDKDWDNYRNHRVGFVFQNYNLIPHQTVLENVELALTLSGIKRKERKARAIEVLNMVGLGDKLRSRPNQLSGGQMQRVAIARALVNDPEIILADEPTGALDSKTSLQIMELLKQVSKDRLVIMVTHNPELAENYSTRIVRLLDGKLISDSLPYSEEESKIEVEEHNKLLEEQKAEKDNLKNRFVKTDKKKSMSPLTALSLSLKNLLTKKGRTTMVAFAGSIGIIGIALILSVSAGMTNYINNMQGESLANYPVAISTVSLDLNSAMDVISSAGSGSESTADDSINVNDESTQLMRMGKINYLDSDFVEYVYNYYEDDNHSDEINAYSISYATNLKLISRTENTDTNATTYKKISSNLSLDITSGTYNSLFFEGLNSKFNDYVLSIYDVVGGENAHFPTNKNEVALVVNSGTASKSLLDSLDIAYETDNGTIKPIKYSNIIGKTYRLLLNDGYYDETGKPYASFSGDLEQDTLSNLYNNSDSTKYEDLTISCILIQKDDSVGTIFSDGIMYTHELAEFYHNDAVNSQAVAGVKAKFLDGEGNLSNGGLVNFDEPYLLSISELSLLEIDPDMFIYETPIEMKTVLSSPMFDLNMTDSDLIDFYLQMYGASHVPTGIYIYAKDFDSKESITEMLDKWNSDPTNREITYSDNSEFITSILGDLVNIISYVLIAFAAISLVVSSIMIGIITYTSVIERTKEIGVLRSIGASKRDVSRVFNAETIIIGLLAGVIGIVVSGLFTILISVILKSLTGIAGLATMEVWSSLILIVVSVVLTFVAGLIPARIASKKDPVTALRSE